MEDLQGLLEKINRDGVEKAEAEAKGIVDAAKAEAKGIVDAAKAEAEKFRSASEKAASESVARAEETIRQAARDIVIEVRESVVTLLEKLLTGAVDKALGAEAPKLVAQAVAELSGPGEITCGPKLAKALQAEQVALGAFKILEDPTAGNGFSVTVDNGRVEHAFTVEAVTAELKKRLRPELAKLL